MDGRSQPVRQVEAYTRIEGRKEGTDPRLCDSFALISSPMYSKDRQRVREQREEDPVLVHSSRGQRNRLTHQELALLHQLAPREEETPAMLSWPDLTAFVVTKLKMHIRALAHSIF
jgi:hypothetical protein